MGCFVGLILIAGMYLNPCTINSLTPVEDTPSQCTISFEGNYADLDVDETCSSINDKIDRKIRDVR